MNGHSFTINNTVVQFLSYLVWTGRPRLIIIYRDLLSSLHSAHPQRFQHSIYGFMNTFNFLRVYWCVIRPRCINENAFTTRRRRHLHLSEAATRRHVVRRPHKACTYYTKWKCRSRKIVYFIFSIYG